MQLVAFGPQGHLATVNSESKTVKVWPPPSQTKEFITKPTWSSGSTLDDIEGSLYRYNYDRLCYNYNALYTHLCVVWQCPPMKSSHG